MVCNNELEPRILGSKNSVINLTGLKTGGQYGS